MESSIHKKYISIIILIINIFVIYYNCSSSINHIMVNDKTINDKTVNDKTVNDKTINYKTVNDKTINDNTAENKKNHIIVVYY